MGAHPPSASLGDKLQIAEGCGDSPAQMTRAANASAEQESRSGQCRLSMACFLEELDPELLLLTPEDRKEVCAGLASLARRPVLEAMLSCLEGLASGE